MHIQKQIKRSGVFLLVASLAAGSQLSPARAEMVPDLSSRIDAETVVKVVSVDPAKHTVVVKRQTGEEETLQLSEEARNLKQLKPGDLISLKVMQSRVVSILDANEAEAGSASMAGGSRSPEGALPGGDAYSEKVQVLKIMKIDTKKNQVTLMGSDGKSNVIDVVNPKIQEKLKSLKVGQMVRVDQTAAISIATVRPK